MKSIALHLICMLSLVLSGSCANDQPAQTGATGQKMSVNDRLAKARAAKAEKRVNPAPSQPGKVEKALPADYQAPVDKVRKGPNGEVVHTGERGAKFYINKNGNKTYLSSNQ